MAFSRSTVSLLLPAFLAVQSSCGPLGTTSKRQASAVPSYVDDYGKAVDCSQIDAQMLMQPTAPFVWIQSQDTYLPSDIGAQLQHTKPEVNFVAVPNLPALTLDNLDILNNAGNTSVYLTSVDDITTNPTWLNGVKPDSNGKTTGAVSTA